MARAGAIAALLLLAGGVALAIGGRSRADERAASLGVSLTIAPGCAVSIAPGLPVSVACTGEVPFQLGVVGSMSSTAPAGPQSEPQILLAPGSESDAVNVVVVY